MGKRSDYERKERDFYPTPMEAFLPLLPHLPYNFIIIFCYNAIAIATAKPGEAALNPVKLLPSTAGNCADPFN